MKIINREDLLKFDLHSLREYQNFCYSASNLTKEEIYLFYEENPLAYYLFIYDLQVLENQLEDIIYFKETGKFL